MKFLATTAALAGLAAAAGAAAMQTRTAPTTPGRLMFYEGRNYAGASFEIDGNRRTLRLLWIAGSIAVHPGERWQICNNTHFREPCVTLDRSVPDTAAIGANGEIASARPLPAAQ